MRIADFPVEKFSSLVQHEFADGWEPGINAAVLVPLLMVDREWHLLFTKRTETIQHHKGQISFPGGRAEKGDKDPIATALRETYEEIGVPPERVRVFGLLDHFFTPTDLHLFPVLGVINLPLEFRLSIEEVSRVFTVPFRWFAEPSNVEMKKIQLPGKGERSVYFFREYQGEVVWGITAGIIVTLFRLIQSQIELGK